MHGPQAAQVERALELVGVVVGEVELALEQLADLVGDALADLEPHGSAELAPSKLDLHRRQEVVGLLLLEGEVGVAAHPEGVGGLHLHAREQLAQMGGDDLLQRHEPLTIGHHHESGQEVRDLDPGEAPLAGYRIAQQDSQVEGQVGDVRERVAGVDGERGEDGEDPSLEGLHHELLVVVVEIAPAGQPDPVIGEGGRHLVQEQVLLPGDEGLDPVAHLEELLTGGAAVRRGGPDAGLHLVLEAGHPHLEELVQVLTEDGEELGPLQQGDGGVGRQRQHPLVEVEPGQLAVQVVRLLDGATRQSIGGLIGRRGHPLIVPRRR